MIVLKSYRAEMIAIAEAVSGGMSDKLAAFVAELKTRPLYGESTADEIDEFMAIMDEMDEE